MISLAALIFTGLVFSSLGLVLKNSSQKTQQKETADVRDKRMHGCLSGKRIVFIGPSTAKMDYLTLAYFAEYGQWPSEEHIFFGGMGEWGPNPVNEAAFRNGTTRMPASVVSPVHKPGCIGAGTAEKTFRYSNNLFNGHEACDCYEFGDWAGARDIYNSTENRIYINGDTLISYFQWFGDIVPPRGTFDITPLLRVPAVPPVQPCPVGQFPGSWAWTSQMKDFLHNVIRYSRPTHVVLSTSFWPIDPANIQFWSEIADAGIASVMDSQGQIIWRSTPQRTDHQFSHASPRVDMAPFVQKGWKVYPAQQIISQYQLYNPDNNAVFYDFAHLRPASQCFLMQNFLQTHVCPGAI